jgi:hypothetical protein
MKRPSWHPGTSRARPPRFLVRWICDSPRSLITSGRSADHDLGRNSAVPVAVSQPFLTRFSKRLKDHRRRHTRWLQHHPCLDMASRNGSGTAEERLEKRPSSGQGHGQRFSQMWSTIVGSRISIGPGIEEGQSFRYQGAPRAAVSPDALPRKVYILIKKSRTP